MNTKLSTTMQKAVRYAKEHGGKLIRYPGGYWAKEGWKGPHEYSFGASTIEALAGRGIVEYTKWQKRKNWSPAFTDHQGEFPIEATIKTSSVSEG